MPKLPADLPENWTQGQTISPNGTEVGLTEKHGYNYLMKQVNNTQTEVNNINEALPDVAQQATVEDIKNKIGTESDADTQPTLFGRLAQLKNVLVGKLAEVLTKVTGIDGKIGISSDTAEDETLFGGLNDIKQNTKEKMLVPSNNLKITVLNTELKGTRYDNVFIGYAIFSHTGFVKLKMSCKGHPTSGDDSPGEVYLGYLHSAVNKGITSDAAFENSLPSKGDIVNDNGGPTFNDYRITAQSIAHLTKSDAYTEYVGVIAVEKGRWYSFSLFGSNSCKDIYCNKLEVYYDEVEVKNNYGD